MLLDVGNVLRMALLLLSQLFYDVLFYRQPSNYETRSINHLMLEPCSILIFMYHSDILLSPSANALFGLVMIM